MVQLRSKFYWIISRIFWVLFQMMFFMFLFHPCPVRWLFLSRPLCPSTLHGFPKKQSLGPQHRPRRKTTRREGPTPLEKRFLGHQSGKDGGRNCFLSPCLKERSWCNSQSEHKLLTGNVGKQTSNRSCLVWKCLGESFHALVAAYSNSSFWREVT